MKFVAGNAVGLETLLPCLPKCVSLSQCRTGTWRESFVCRKESVTKEKDMSSGKSNNRTGQCSGNNVNLHAGGGRFRFSVYVSP